MNEYSKIKEAKYFFDKMKKTKASYDELVFNLSAFISASRSVMQYMHNETKENSNLVWYDNKMSSSDILKFFKSNRDLNIHLVPINLQKGVEIQVSTLNLSAIIASTSISSTGGVVFTTTSQPSSSSSSSSSSKENSTQSASIDKYKFDPNWYTQIKINEHFTQTDKDLCLRICQHYDVLTFCETYIFELEAIVEEGINSGYITETA